MENIIRNIIREEFESVMSKVYSEDEIMDAILNKSFVHTKKGNVYSPVKLEKGSFIGVNNDCQHFNIPLEEISLIQSKKDRFGK